MTTQELVERLRADADTVDAIAYDGCWEIKETDRGSRLRAAASRIEKTDAENKRLRDALQGSKALVENMMRHGGFVSVPISSWTSETRSEAKQLWCVPTWHLGDAEIVVREARATLEHDKGEPKP